MACGGGVESWVSAISRPLIALCGPIGEELGVECEGSWKNSQDKPHLQLRMGIALGEARQRVKEGRPVA